MTGKDPGSALSAESGRLDSLTALSGNDLEHQHHDQNADTDDVGQSARMDQHQTGGDTHDPHAPVQIPEHVADHAGGDEEHTHRGR